MFVGLGRRGRTDAVHLVAHDDDAGHGVVHGPEIHRPLRQLRRIQPVPLRLEHREGIRHAGVGVGGDPIETASGGLAEGPEALPGPDHMHIGHTKGIAGTDDRRQITGLVDLVGQHPEVWLAGVQSLLDSGEAFRGHGASFFPFSRPRRPGGARTFPDRGGDDTTAKPETAVVAK